MTGQVHRINVSDGGVPKTRVAEARVLIGGLANDRQGDPRYHGGPERAVSLFSLEVIGRLAGDGHPIGPGTTGENLTIAGLSWSLVSPGARLVLERGVVLEITSYCSPCSKIAASFQDGDSGRICQKRHAGESRVYARVVREGLVREGEGVELVEAGGPRIGLAVVGPDLS